jgi:hypothetical protein
MWFRRSCRSAAVTEKKTSINGAAHLSGRLRKSFGCRGGVAPSMCRSGVEGGWVHEDDLIPMGRELIIHRLARGGVPRIEGIAGAPFTIFYGEVSGDSDGPVEWCWPVPDDQADEIAARFPDLTLRTEPAHQEAFVRPDAPGMGGGGTQAELAIEALFAWASEQHREPSGGVRSVLVFNPANQGAGPDTEFAVPLR